MTINEHITYVLKPKYGHCRGWSRIADVLRRARKTDDVPAELERILTVLKKNQPQWFAR